MIDDILGGHDREAPEGLSDKVYRDEPLLFTASQIKQFTPVRFRQMRDIAQKRDRYALSDAKLFYEQGKFMAEFEDDYVYEGEFSQYFPSYQAMNDFQLRGYFSWRTKVRKGIIEKTSFSYAFVYVYELLNQIAVPSPEEGYQTLYRFWQTYRTITPQIDRYLHLWLQDYVVFYGLDPSLLTEFNSFDQDLLTLMDYMHHTPEEIFQALHAHSAYNLEKSRFYQSHAEDIKQVIYQVVASLSADEEGKGKTGLCEKLFGRITAYSYVMFNSAIFYHKGIHADTRFEVNPLFTFICKDGRWICERILWRGGKNHEIGALLKAIDYHMRKRYGFKSTLKEAKISKRVLQTVLREIEKLLKTKRQKAQPKVQLDLSKLQGIRETAQMIQQKLIVQEDGAEELPLFEPYGQNDIKPGKPGSLKEPTDPHSFENPPKAGPSMRETQPEALNKDLNLTQAEYRLLHGMLYDEDYSGILKEQGLLLSVLVDAVNEKLYDRFSDTVICYPGEKPELIEDYIKDLKGIIKE